MLSKSGVPPRVAQRLMRHSDIRLTMQTYTDPKFFDLKGANRLFAVRCTRHPAFLVQRSHRMAISLSLRIRRKSLSLRENGSIS